MKQKLNIINDCRGTFPQDAIEVILQSRGIKDIKHYLNPKEEDLLSPFDLLNMDIATELTFQALEDNEKFLVFFDTDNDGISSGTIVYNYLKSLNANVEWYINHGKQHGCNKEFIKQLTIINPSLLIIVDSLDGDLNYYSQISEMGIKTIVLDHHAVNNLPYADYVCLVSSQVDYPNPALSGAGVCLKYIMALDHGIGLGTIDNYYCLAASGILSDMCDVSVDSYENRYIVKRGLEHVKNASLKKLGGGFDFNSSTIAFSVAPKINAANRLDRNEIAVQTMLADDGDELTSYSRKLTRCKTEQDKAVEVLMPDVIKQCEEQNSNKLLVVFTDTEYGINGLIGNKLLSMFNKPVLVLRDDGIRYSGSARAVGVEDFRTLCLTTELCEARGHENAFGFECLKDNFEEFKIEIEKILSDIEFENMVDVDALLNLDDVDNSLIEMVKKCDFVSGMNSKPLRFAIEIDDYEISNFSKGKHLVLKCKNMIFIKWNFAGNWEELEDCSVFGIPILCYGTIQSGFIGRKFYNQMILDGFEIKYED